MQAIILAAGYGKRLQPLTDHVPKCLVPVRGKPLLIRSLELLDLHGVREAVLVVGHMQEAVYRAIGQRFGNIRISYVVNTVYDKTNNVYSLWLAREHLRDDCLLLECDLYYGSALLDALTQTRRDCTVLVSPYDPARMNGTVITVGKQNVITGLFLKKDQGDNFTYADKYKTVNMYYLGGEFLRRFFLPYLDLYVRVHGGQNYYEQVLGLLIYIGQPPCHAVVVDADQWCEIDDAADLRRAETCSYCWKAKPSVIEEMGEKSA